MSRPNEDDDCYLPIDGIEFFRQLNGRQFNTMNHTYLLPSDNEEIKSTYLGWLALCWYSPSPAVRSIAPHHTVYLPRTDLSLDLGTGKGDWAVQLSEEIPWVFVTSVDIVPIQQREVPERCRFEIWDINTPDMPYKDAYFDLIHARAIHTGIRDYPRFLHQIACILRPGGLVILIEPDLVQYIWCLPPTYSLEVN
ncbi:S-adenosyl-L-methionine-dependent methyltransferase [Mycena venus]|uniref:S-adenosyl-L-methionine-dependent methyltransferase n=1 Tax=Mycena venus TaxID=2733690 RepID=A0A8H6WXV8_9AGAR|nr:S-adenosyl-L-methionine-dependent methyltransferase [Mycena venus]